MSAADDLVCVLMAGAEEKGADGKGALAAAAEALPAALAARGGMVGAGRWLTPGRAFEQRVSELPPETARATAGRVVGAAPLDLAVLPAAGRRKRLLVADMESTIIAEELLDELARRAGCGTEIAAITARAMAGEFDFADSLAVRLDKLAGMPLSELEAVVAAATPDPGARALIATMRAQGAHLALVSGGLTFFTGRIARDLGFDSHYGNEAEIADGRLTGRLARPVRGAEGKSEILLALAAELDLDPAESLAVGDGANDTALLAAAGLGVAYRAKPALRGVADVEIEHADLSALLHLQGYSTAEIHGATE